MIYRILELTLAPALRVGYRPQANGAELVPATGPVILAANHVSFADEFFTPLCAGRRVVYFAKAEYFNTPGLQGPGHGGVLPRLRARAGGARGHPLGRVGHRHRRGGAGRGPGARDLPRGHPLARRPAVQVPHRGGPAGPAQRRAGRAGRAWSAPATCSRPAARLWHRAPVQVNFGAPLEFGHLADQERSSRVLREVTETVREQIQALSGQEYVDAYAASAKLAG